jgi:hypothetical protein
MNYIDEACWKGYQQYGMKQKGGKQVPNCVPIKEAAGYCSSCLIEYIKRSVNENECINVMSPGLNESEYHGRSVKLGKPFLTPDGPKKRSVYVKNAKGNVVKVNFGDPNMRIKKHIPARRRSYRARHHCENPGPRWKANYWSCRAW